MFPNSTSEIASKDLFTLDFSAAAEHYQFPRTQRTNLSCTGMVYGLCKYLYKNLVPRAQELHKYPSFLVNIAHILKLKQRMFLLICLMFQKIKHTKDKSFYKKTF